MDGYPFIFFKQITRYPAYETHEYMQVRAIRPIINDFGEDLHVGCVGRAQP